MKKTLNAKDFILIGVLSALMWIICMIISTVMSVAGPVTNICYPSGVAIAGGIVMMLLLAKVPKRGVFTISSVIQGILLMLVGCFWVVSLMLIVGGVVCDLLVMRGEKISMGAMKGAFAIFSGFFQLGYLFPFVFMKDAYTDVMLGNGISQDFIDSLFGVTAGVMPVVIVALGVLCGFIGGTIGQRVLKKHFIKAGLVSVK